MRGREDLPDCVEGTAFGDGLDDEVGETVLVEKHGEQERVGGPE